MYAAVLETGSKRAEGVGLWTSAGLGLGAVPGRGKIGCRCGYGRSGCQNVHCHLQTVHQPNGYRSTHWMVSSTSHAKCVLGSNRSGSVAQCCACMHTDSGCGKDSHGEKSGASWGHLIIPATERGRPYIHTYIHAERLGEGTLLLIAVTAKPRYHEKESSELQSSPCCAGWPL